MGTNLHTHIGLVMVLSWSTIGCVSPGYSHAVGNLSSAGASFVAGDGPGTVDIVTFDSVSHVDDDLFVSVADDIQVLKPRSLNLGRTAVTDLSASTIAQFSTLRQVTLARTGFTFTGIQRIAAETKSIRYIFVSAYQVPGGTKLVLSSCTEDVAVIVTPLYDF